jgi:hypothetical protein
MSTSWIGFSSSYSSHFPSKTSIGISTGSNAEFP